jgi:hypothetical protein
VTFYRIRKEIDVQLHNDVDGEFALHEIIGVTHRRHYTNATELRAAGWDVVEITRPEEDPPGTIRRFVDSGGRMIKHLSGEWLYLTNDGAGRRVTISELREYDHVVEDW